ncbi:hypothetical protein V2J09_006036 [Rumex salicifolius]
MYMSKSLSCKLFLNQRLYGLKMSKSSDLVQHVNTFNQIIGDLGCVGVKVDDEDQAMVLVCLLTPAYETLLTALTCGKESISLETVSSVLLSHNNDGNIPVEISLKATGCILATTRKGNKQRSKSKAKKKQSALVVEK